MKKNDKRYNRQIALFGEEGQYNLRTCHAVLPGAGGINMHTIQQLAHLGVGKMSIIEPEKLDTSNLNRYVGARYDDVGKDKTEIAGRMIKEIDPQIEVELITAPLVRKGCSSEDCVVRTAYLSPRIHGGALGGARRLGSGFID